MRHRTVLAPLILATAAAQIVVIGAAMAQQPTVPQAWWSGWRRCEISVQAAGYADKQTHTWQMAGGAPSREGAFQVYAATWSVAGGGSFSKTQGKQTLAAEWSTDAHRSGASIAVFVRASDGRMFIQARHPQLRAPGSVNGYQQVTFDGKRQKPQIIASEAFEFMFDAVEIDPKKPSVSGSSTPIVNGALGFMQPGGARATASCTWQFGRDAAAPAPPTSVIAPPVPVAPPP